MGNLKQAPATVRNDVACLGSVASIEAPKLTSSGNYHGFKVKIEGHPGQGVNITQSIFFRPEWLHPDFQPAIHIPEGDGAIFMFKKFLGALDTGIGALQGLCGTAERFQELDSIIPTLDVDDKGIPTLESIDEKVLEFLRQTKTVGYIRTQKREKVSAAGEKSVYQPTKGFEIGTAQYNGFSWFYTDNDSLKAVYAEAKRRVGKTYNGVEMPQLEIMFGEG